MTISEVPSEISNVIKINRSVQLSLFEVAPMDETLDSPNYWTCVQVDCDGENHFYVHLP